MNTFKIGDKVEVLTVDELDPDWLKPGMVGEIVELDSVAESYVEFGEGHASLWNKDIKLVKPASTLRTASALPIDSAERKKYPVYSGFMVYFPHAIARVAHLSWQGNQQHHDDKPLHWDMDKSTDERDCDMRHTIDMICAQDAETEIDEAARKAWRSMANLERLLTGKCKYSPFMEDEHED